MSDCHPRDAVYARLLLQSCATQWSVAVNMQDGQLMNNAVDALEGAALGLAAAQGAPNALERAELETLRRFRDGIGSLRTELTACSDLNLVKETIDALVAMSFPLRMEPK